MCDTFADMLPLCFMSLHTYIYTSLVLNMLTYFHCLRHQMVLFTTTKTTTNAAWKISTFALLKLLILFKSVERIHFHVQYSRIDAVWFSELFTWNEHRIGMRMCEFVRTHRWVPIEILNWILIRSLCVTHHEHCKLFMCMFMNDPFKWKIHAN